MSDLVILNFSHPLTPDQRAAIEGKVGQRIECIIDVPVHFDHERPFDDQVAELLAPIDIDLEQTPLLVILPSLSAIAAVLLARLHGITGHFPTVIRLKPTSNADLTEYVFAELLPLNRMRNDARASRRINNDGDRHHE